MTNAVDTGSLWAISCYFNPAGYESRRRNYRAFRQQLKLPLVTVELASEGNFELGPGDADVLVQRRSPDVMWQKERLLNVALESLPDECEFVAWLDCDIVIPDERWPERTLRALERDPLVQAFRTLYDLPIGADPRRIEPLARSAARDALVWQWSAGTAPPDLFTRSGGSVNYRYSAGHAWAARRELIGRSGLYDARILGSGNKLMAAAAFGAWSEIGAAYAMNDAQVRHFAEWASPFSQAVNGRVGFVDATVFHLWHGDLAKRGLARRYLDFAKFDFDPYRDIELNAESCWRWATHKPEMHAHVRSYFSTRDEDAVPEHVTP